MHWNNGCVLVSHWKLDFMCNSVTFTIKDVSAFIGSPHPNVCFHWSHSLNDRHPLKSPEETSNVVFHDFIFRQLCQDLSRRRKRFKKKKDPSLIITKSKRKVSTVIKPVEVKREIISHCVTFTATEQSLTSVTAGVTAPLIGLDHHTFFLGQSIDTLHTLTLLGALLHSDSSAGNTVYRVWLIIFSFYEYKCIMITNTLICWLTVTTKWFEVCLLNQSPITFWFKLSVSFKSTFKRPQIDSAGCTFVILWNFDETWPVFFLSQLLSWMARFILLSVFCVFLYQVDRFLHAMRLHDDQLVDISARFQAEMKKGLSAESSAAAAVKMLPTHVRSTPDGSGYSS